VHEKKDKLEEHQTEKPCNEKKDPVFQIEEITIEEMAIDGICGVY
jgi:mycofactocin precursor